MGEIIDKPMELINLTSDELDQVLLDEKYNKANLRELVKRCLHMTKVCKEMSEHHKSFSEEYRKKLMKIKSILE